MEFIKKYKNYIRGIILFLLFFVFNDFVVSILGVFGLNLSKLPTIPKQIISIIISLIFPIVLFIIYRNDFKKDLKKSKNNIRFYIETAVTAYTVGIICMVITNVIIQTFVKLPIATNEQGIRAMLEKLPLYVFISAAFIGPFEEEMIFRRALRDIFKNKTLYLFASSLIFGSLHVIPTLSNPLELLYIVPYSALGFSFAYMYTKTDNIYVSILVHVIHNTFLLSLQLLVM